MLIIYNNWAKQNIGASPSGKATDSDSVIRVFESLRPSQKRGFRSFLREFERFSALFYAVWGLTRGLIKGCKAVFNLLRLFFHILPWEVRINVACLRAVRRMPRPYGNNLAGNAALLAPCNKSVSQFVQMVVRHKPFKRLRERIRANVVKLRKI